ncbi:MAG: hypothetical protein GY755_16730 [Chloroflexi bacterium]|nr:hypothetical protein [Chloroflexota bacterium]
MKKGNITGGLILILLGVWFLAIQFVPQMKVWAEGSWALSIIGIAAIFLVVSILNNIPGLSIPAFIIGGIGGLLYYQNVTGDWESWAYAWTFIPGFVGLGLLFFSLQARDKGTMQAGFILLFISAVLFFVFGSFLGASKQLIQYWPLLLILAGASSMIRSLFGKKREKRVESAPVISSPIEAEAIPSVDGEAEVVEETEGEEDEN